MVSRARLLPGLWRAGFGSRGRGCVLLEPEVEGSFLPSGEQWKETH